MDKHIRLMIGPRIRKVPQIPINTVKAWPLIEVVNGGIE
jgi:hypothetical protein